jgi:ketosteroid isomerase-like protein
MNETLDLIRRYYDAFNRADWSAMLALLDENVAHDVNQGGRERGAPVSRPSSSA